MTPEQREAIRSNAKYLRNVRPVDPEEIHEYVEGRPHPAAVRQALREEAVDLELVENEDGVFVPAPEGAVERPAGRVERLPDAYARVVDDLLVERFGPGWPEGESGERIRASIRRLKEDYYRGREANYDADTALGYAIYHLPDYYAAARYVLDDLVERRLLPRRLRVVDVGAGVGGPAIGLHDHLAADVDAGADGDPPRDALVDYHAVEPSEPAAEVLESLLDETGPNFHATVHRDPAEAFDPPECDLLLFANVLSELADPVAVASRYAEALADDGSLVAIAPADLETSTGLREVERELAGNLTVYSPTIRLWPGHEPTDRCWSFDVEPDLEVPVFQRRLDDAAGGTGEFVNVDVQYSHAILRPDGARRIEFVAGGDRLARMADAEEHVTDRIDLVAIKLSHDLADDGNQIYLVGDGSQRVDHYAVLARETGLNGDLRTADYGDLLFFESALCLWNEDEAAYNLVVDGESIVDAPPGA